MSTTFVCNTVPALGIGLVSQMYCFEGGKLVLENDGDIAAIRKHPWYNVRIFEQRNEPVSVPLLDADSSPSGTIGASQLVRSGLKNLLREEMEGGFRCVDCGATSPLFPTEKAALKHLRSMHKYKFTTGGGT
jgi:hypothetical protein